MENIALVLIAAIAAYAIFKAFTSTIDLIFKIVIGMLVVSFIGYTVLGWQDIAAQPPAIEHNQTLLLNPENISAAAEQNETVEIPANNPAQTNNSTPNFIKN